ncbi:MAG: hypothetical protein EOP88_21145 [Verrucomicrobiaceae bacterium]|nr:MAG: hypothetical protein EOP88_21145 [Verrucomicrobiaceae bacterium]
MSEDLDFLPTSVQIYMMFIKTYMEYDLQTFEEVASKKGFDGKLGVAMITNACAAMNVVGWLFHQKFSNPVGDGKLFEYLLADERFFQKGELAFKPLYQLVRCGVVHQYYPKSMNIAINPASNEIYGQVWNKPVVNAIAFYRRIFKVVMKADSIIQNLSQESLRDFDLKLLLRQRMDLEDAEAADFKIANLPVFSEGHVIQQ